MGSVGGPVARGIRRPAVPGCPTAVASGPPERKHALQGSQKQGAGQGGAVRRRDRGQVISGPLHQAAAPTVVMLLSNAWAMLR